MATTISVCVGLLGGSWWAWMRRCVFTSIVTMLSGHERNLRSVGVEYALLGQKRWCLEVATFGHLLLRLLVRLESEPVNVEAPRALVQAGKDPLFPVNPRRPHHGIFSTAFALGTQALCEFREESGRVHRSSPSSSSHSQLVKSSASSPPDSFQLLNACRMSPAISSLV